jgi:osmotically-inducible protein OsmY
MYFIKFAQICEIRFLIDFFFRCTLLQNKMNMNNKNRFTRMLAMVLAVSVLFTACKPNDAAIAESVKTKISSVAQGLGVDVKNGVVTLTGQVADDATKAAVESALKGMKGVKSVVNSLTLPPPPPPVVINPDDTLRSAIQAAFDSKGIKGIVSAISNGEVTLTGDVKKADLAKVMQAANEAKPKKVINNMKVIK